MSKEALILDTIYLLVMVIGFIWCLPYSKSIDVLFSILIGSIIWALVSYGMWGVYKILDRKNVLSDLVNKSLSIMMYLPYMYLIIFLLIAFIGMVRVFVLKIIYMHIRFFSFNGLSCDKKSSWNDWKIIKRALL